MICKKFSLPLPNLNQNLKKSLKSVDGETNAAIEVIVAKVFGIGSSSVEILRGDKSRNKRIKLLVEITAKKDKNIT
jgi:uncharacterized protein YggU (UPF0235/DUF167 family)